ncbi:MAG TPA: beta-N-acetylhexosaminidase [Gemmatimonadaceae bacterium]|nr:beta-N-acetylhexosaminidase [Gemmatimonadaceae bacterium]
MTRVALITAVALLAACTTVPAPIITTPVQRPAVTTPQLVPAPSSLTFATGAPFDLNRRTSFIVEGVPSAEVTAIAEMFATLLRPSTGFPLAVTSSAADTAAGNIHVRLAPDQASLGEEGYSLTVTPSSVVLVARRPAGIFHGVQTLRQLLPVDVESEIGMARFEWPIPSLSIVDRPRFGWRGAMLDVARHFFTVHEAKQYIDLLALYKLNVLHLHLSDDQGWRIEIKSRPKLANIGGSTQVGGGPGGFFTQQDYQTIVRYAQARYITVVPEIDMPGHTNAALVAYPELSCSTRPPQSFIGIETGWSAFCVDKEGTYALIDDVVREISAITPGSYFHIGGDEAKVLSHEHYARFVERVQGIVRRHGKKMVGWEEITKAQLDPSTLAQQWKSDSATEALKHGAKLIMSPYRKVYLDMKYARSGELGVSWGGFIEFRDAYDWDPANYIAGVGESNIAGVEAPLWSETARNITAVEFLAMPRLPAVAEVAWTPQQGRDWESFRVRLATHAPRWNLLGVNYYRSPQIPW